MDVLARFAQMVEQHPTRVAVLDPHASLTYAALDAATDALATAVRQRPASDRPVPVLAAHGIPSVVAMLAVAKAGRAYLLLDPHEPADFSAAMATRFGDGPVLEIESMPAVAAPVHRDPTPTIDPHTPVSVSATSGTSGTPKAVVHSHGNVVANATRYAGAIDATADDVFLVVGPFAAQAAATPTYAALLTGATLCAYDLRALGAAGLPEFTTVNGVTVAHVPPAALGALAPLAPMPGVRLVSLGGDRVSAGQLAQARAAFPHATLLHRYSTSETNWIAGWSVGPGAPLPTTGTGPLPIGRPVPWLQVRVIDEQGHDVSVGEVGELEVTGDHLALGYLEDDARTADRFREHADSRRGLRTYRTGDRVRMRSDGELEFAGRADAVRKVRGVLVDLAAVEAALQAQPGVEAAAVVQRDTDDGASTELVGFVVGTGVSAPALRTALTGSLPAAMVPASVIVLDALPLTPRGKVDTAALDAIASNRTAPPFAPPFGASETRIAMVFAEVLGRDRCGRDDDIIDAGADSLALVELQHALSTEFGRELPPSVLLAHPTPAGLAAAWADAPGSPRSESLSVVRLRTGDPSRLPVVVFSGGGGGHLEGAALMAPWLEDRSVYTVVPHGFEHRGRADRTIEAMGARAAAALRERGHDRLVLVGHSSGGNVALETARHLADAGVEIPVVVLLDTIPITEEVVGARRWHRWVRTSYTGGNRIAHTVTFARDWIERWWLANTAGLVRRTGAAQHRAFDARVRRSLRRRLEPPYAGRVLLVRADDVAGRELPEDLRWSQVGVGTLVMARIRAPHDLMLGARYAPITGVIVERECRRWDPGVGEETA